MANKMLRFPRKKRRGVPAKGLIPTFEYIPRIGMHHFSGVKYVPRNRSLRSGLRIRKR